MPESVEIPDDLIALQRAQNEALAALGGPDVGSPSNWSPQQRDEWDRRWEAYRTAANAVNEHPAMRRAVEQRTYPELRTALRRAARVPGPAGAMSRQAQAEA
jgi:hypothetical protein